MNNNIFEKDVFMICEKINENAYTNLSPEYSFKKLKTSELETWKGLPYYEYEYSEKERNNMTDWYKKLYEKNEKEFFKKCMVVCNRNDEIIGTCFLWKSYNNRINSVHWLKVIPPYENKGIGRALLSVLFRDINKNDLPIFLHTQVGSYRAIKLYSDFGFKILSDKIIHRKNNDIKVCKDLLRQYMLEKYFKKLKYKKAPKYFLRIINEYEHSEI
jgi:ribosomal protein S18 acetylase RimI-like enzyme